MKQSILRSIFAANLMQPSSTANTGSYGYNKDGSVRTDLEYIRELGMPNLNKTAYRTNKKANSIKKRMRKLQRLARKVTRLFRK